VHAANDCWSYAYAMIIYIASEIGLITLNAEKLLIISSAIPAADLLYSSSA